MVAYKEKNTGACFREFGVLRLLFVMKGWRVLFDAFWSRRRTRFRDWQGSKWTPLTSTFYSRATKRCTLARVIRVLSWSCHMLNEHRRCVNRFEQGIRSGINSIRSSMCVCVRGDCVNSNAALFSPSNWREISFCHTSTSLAAVRTRTILIIGCFAALRCFFFIDMHVCEYSFVNLMKTSSTRTKSRWVARTD